MNADSASQPMPDEAVEFDEMFYLARYPDVARVVSLGGRASGYSHYVEIGRSKGRFASARDEAMRSGPVVLPPGQRPAPMALRAVPPPPARMASVVSLPPAIPAPTVALVPAVTKAPAVTTADRLALNNTDPNAFDARFYCDHYPMAVADVDRGLAADFREHYDRYGRHRGYLPNKRASREENPASFHSRFGGFWIDQANALDLLDAKEDLGHIPADQAKLIRQFITDGYIVLRGALPDDILDRAQNVLERAYNGDMPEVEFNITGVGRKVHWRPDVLTKPAKALDLHWLSADVRNMSLHDNVLRTLSYIMERRAFATQTLGFWRGSAQDAHQDSAYVNYSHPNQFLATWIALEDVTENCGELFYYVGSHRMEEYLYLDKYKGVEEAGRANPGMDFDAPIKDHVKKIPQVADRMHLQRKRFLAKRGDVLIWHSDLAHGGSPISTDVTRKSIVTHYCTAEAVPSYFELKEGKRIMRHGGGYVGSAHYNTDLGF
ncbi:MAG: phytanoyl-CoA dioxygenase family protein [Alphaproteobacteria bacterium]|nr:phytanoyl-CoA dioxygenase family protein [Alphaproteobacteria bacterium]